MDDFRAEILRHYRISPQEVSGDVEGLVNFVDNRGLEKMPIGLFVSNYCKNQQTVIDYDEDYGVFVIRAYPKAYGELNQPPEPKTRAPYTVWSESEGLMHSYDLKGWKAGIPGQDQ